MCLELEATRGESAHETANLDAQGVSHQAGIVEEWHQSQISPGRRRKGSPAACGHCRLGWSRGAGGTRAGLGWPRYAGGGGRAAVHHVAPERNLERCPFGRRSHASIKHEVDVPPSPPPLTSPLPSWLPPSDKQSNNWNERVRRGQTDRNTASTQMQGRERATRRQQKNQSGVSYVAALMLDTQHT